MSWRFCFSSFGCDQGDNKSKRVEQARPPRYRKLDFNRAVERGSDQSSRHDGQVRKLRRATQLPSLINLRRGNSAPIDERTTHVPWNLRKLLSQALATCDVFDTQEAINFARCTLLRTSQWALDCKRYVPNKEDFLRQHAEHAAKMLSGAEEFSKRVRTSHKTASIKDQMILCTCSAAEMGTKALPLKFRKPKLLITSPPYPGVHMLYPTTRSRALAGYVAAREPHEGQITPLNVHRIHTSPEVRTRAANGIVKSSTVG